MKYLYQKTGLILYRILLPFLRPMLRNTKRVYVVLIYEKHIILVKNWLARDTWRLPGGGISKGESAVDAAVREIYEELHITLKAKKLVQFEEGKMRLDGLGYEYTYYYYNLDQHPRIQANKYEIVDHDVFKDLPGGIQPDLLKSIEKLRVKKLVY